ncbi:bacillithiol transferase BstA [soil metagenome]
MLLESHHLRYPIGRFEKPQEYTPEQLNEWIGVIAAFPAELKADVQHLTDNDLALTYRPDGWNIRQVVHHCADSHMNAFIRFKLALTEDAPLINAYKEDVWANLSDTTDLPLEPSLRIIEGLHQRWAKLLRSISGTQWLAGYIHPEHGKHVGLQEATGQYAWHCRHHLAHVRIARGLQIS